MSVTAGKVDDWYLVDLDTDLTVEPVVEGDEEGGYEKYEHYILTIERKLRNVIVFNEEVGTKKGSFTFKTGADATMTFSSTKKKWLCTKDRIGEVDTVTGECLQTQVWEHFSEREPLEDGEYGG